MLDFQTYEVKAKDRTESKEIRYDKALANLLTEASCALGVDEDDFIRTVIQKEATHVIEQGKRLVLSAKDAEQFVNAILSDEPVKPSEYALKVAREYRERVVNAK